MDNTKTNTPAEGGGERARHGDGTASTIAAIAADPSLARFQFRARNRWIDGGENRSTIKDFYGAGKDDNSRTTAFEFTNGEPPVLLGNNEGANPVEFLLHALEGCVTTTFVLHAAARGVSIMSLSTELEGEIDLRGLLAIDEAVAPGYGRIRIKLHVAADCSEAELDELLAHGPKAFAGLQHGMPAGAGGDRARRRMRQGRPAASARTGRVSARNAARSDPFTATRQ